jgi:hypothetical protein
MSEARETCVTLRTAYAGDVQIATLCPNTVPADSVGVKPKAIPAPVPVKKKPS